MKIQIQSNHQNSRKINQDKIDEREAWHKIVVKVLRWIDENPEKSLNLTTLDKVTAKEWTLYCERSISINVIKGKNITTEKLKEIEKTIKERGGFE